jgi:hypothetical protein
MRQVTWIYAKVCAKSSDTDGVKLLHDCTFFVLDGTCGLVIQSKSYSNQIGSGKIALWA